MLFEFLFDILLEGSVEAAKDKKLSPWIRIPCLVLVLIMTAAVIGGLAFLGIYMLTSHSDATDAGMGIFCLAVDLILILGAIREYKKYKNQSKTKKK
jgi:hypothetical protein